MHEVDVHGLHDRVLHYLGRLHLRTSYSQNVLAIRSRWHSLRDAGRNGRSRWCAGQAVRSVARHWEGG